MAHPHRPRRLTPDQQRRLLRALGASAATGLLVYLAVMRLALPALAAKLTPEGREWLRQAFASHPYWVLAGLVAFAALTALPVLAVFRLVYGPLRANSGR